MRWASVSRITILLGSKRRLILFLKSQSARPSRGGPAACGSHGSPSTRTRPDTVRVPFHSSSLVALLVVDGLEDVVIDPGDWTPLPPGSKSIHVSRTPLLGEDSDTGPVSAGARRRPPAPAASRLGAAGPRTCRRYRIRCAAHFLVVLAGHGVRCGPREFGVGVAGAGTNSPLARS